MTIVDEFASRYGIPVTFYGEDPNARSRYARECQRLRNEMPAGECRVAPRVSLSTPRGRPLEPGTLVAAEDFDDGAPMSGFKRLEEMIEDGYVLRSERQTAQELAEIAEHVARVKALNAAFVADTSAAKLGKLLERDSQP